MTPLDGALWLVQHGFAVFPCDHPGTPNCTGLHKSCDGSRGKHPAVAFTRGWTLDERKVRETFARGLRNPAVSVGACSGPEGAQLVVVDSDRPGAIEDVAGARGETWPTTMRDNTAKGYHDFVWAPAGLKLGNGLGSLQGQFDGDIRAGRSFVVGPGAVHATGVVYELEDPERPPVMAPGWLLRALLTKPQRPVRQSSYPRPESRSLQGLVKFVADSTQGQRNSRLFWAACRAAEGGVDDAPAVLLDAAIHVGLAEAEARSTIASAFRTVGASS